MRHEALALICADRPIINSWVHEKQDAADVIVLYETWACSKDDFISKHLSKP